MELHRLKLKVPDDLSIITREYSWFSQYQIPPMTTVMPDYEEIGRQALNLLDRLIERDSVGRILPRIKSAVPTPE